MAKRLWVVASLVLGAWAVSGCGGDSTVMHDAPPGGVCTDDSDCDDGAFCTGTERCMPGDPGASATGCLAGTSPCAPGRTCDEASDTCLSTCSAERDADGDGVISMACGGPDCDDMDLDRFPGHPEVCDVDDHDEDCDPTTFGFRDSDMDTYPDEQCCNEDACGTDCDDAQPSVHPTEAEGCDGLDNDCDELIDETVRVRCWVDADEDGYASDGAAVMEACDACPIGQTSREPTGTEVDCDDTLDTVAPGAIERCDGLDSDCSSGGGADSAEDEDGDMHTAVSFAGCMDGFPRDDCEDIDDRVFPGQTMYFGRPYCPLGTFESGSCVAGSCRVGSPTGACMPVARWDYDCDGATEREPAASGCSSPGGCSLMACPRRSGPDYTGTPPACGTTMNQLTCGCGTGFTCRFFPATPATAPLGCH